MFRTVPLSNIRSFLLYTQRKCPKHLEVCSKNKFENIVRLVGFIIRIDLDLVRKEIAILRFTIINMRSPTNVKEDPPPLPTPVLMNFRGFPPGCGDSVADFWGWDAHEARLRCPDDVSGDMQEDEISGGSLSLNLLTTQTMVTTGIFPCKEKFPW